MLMAIPSHYKMKLFFQWYCYLSGTSLPLLITRWCCFLFLWFMFLRSCILISCNFSICNRLIMPILTDMDGCCIVFIDSLFSCYKISTERLGFSHLVSPSPFTASYFIIVLDHWTSDPPRRNWKKSKNSSLRVEH